MSGSEEASGGGSAPTISVAVIDSGANVPHPHLPAVAGGVAFDLDGAARDDWIDRLGHGTAVAAAIHEKAPDAAIHVVKVFDGALATSVKVLVRALDWASERGLRIVNLSLGTPNDFRAAELEAPVRRAIERGTIVVSALREGDALFYPGCMEGVVGVLLDEAQPRDAVAVVETEDGPAAVAAPYPRPIPGVPPERNLSGISFAVANVSGVLAARLATRPGVRTAAGAMGLLGAEPFQVDRQDEILGLGP